jgi:DNA-binding CsgD family transcriptional regulator
VAIPSIHADHDVVATRQESGNRATGAVSLSPRESDVLSLASRGLTNRQIARELSVSVHGVKFHLGSIFRKLGVENRTAAAAVYAREAPFLDHPRDE